MQQTLKNYDTELDTEVPSYILEEYNHVTLNANVFFVNGLAFLAAMPTHLGLIQCIYLQKQTNKHLIENFCKFDE